MAMRMRTKPLSSSDDGAVFCVMGNRGFPFHKTISYFFGALSWVFVLVLENFFALCCIVQRILDRTFNDRSFGAAFS